jgi:nitronate monooxygenase
MIGGMGVDISSIGDLALEVARLGGIGHISDAMIHGVRPPLQHQVRQGQAAKLYKYNVANRDKSEVKFDLGVWPRPRAELCVEHHGRQARRGHDLHQLHGKADHERAAETLRVRLASALDAGIDGITLAAGLHLGSFALIEDHPRFRDAKLGIIVSSLRALQLFLRKNAKLNRLPDYVVVEGPLAGGHLGFGMDWAQYDLATITRDPQYLNANNSTSRSSPPAASSPAAMRCRFLEKGSRRGAGGHALHRHHRVRLARRRSSRNTSRPARTTSRSTPSRPPATRCAC